MAAGFSIRAYVERLRNKKAAELGPFAFAAKDLPPMEVRHFRWWEDELVAIKASKAAAAAEEEEEGEDEEEELAPGKGRAPKKRSISDLFATAPPVEPSSSSGASRAGEDDEVLCEIVRRAKEMRRRRRVEAEAAAAAAAALTTAPAETSSAGETREGEASAGKGALDKTHLQDELDIPELAEEHEAEQNISTFQKNKADKLKHTESKKAKVDKQRDLEKLIPLHSILKKYTKHTTVKVVKEKHGNPKRTGVIELCRKSVKRVKFSEANDVHGSDKQSSKMPQLENLCKLFSDAMTSSSSTDVSSEGDRHIAAESSSSHKPEKASTKAQEANENEDHGNCCKVSNTGSSGLFDLNMALPESTELNGPYTSNSEVPSVEHTQHGTFSVDEQTLDNGRENQKHATDLDIRAKGKSHALPNRTGHDSVQLQQSWCSMNLQHGVSQLSTGEMNTQQECWPATAPTFRLMGKDLPLSTSTGSYLAETSQKQAGPSDKDNFSAKLVLGLPRQGRPFLSLQAPSAPIVSVTTASTVHDSANPAGKIQAQFGYRTPHNISQPLSSANISFGDPSQYEDRFWNSASSGSRRNVLLGYPPLPNNSSEEYRQSSRGSWHHYSDHSTGSESPSEPISPAIMQNVTRSSEYHAGLPQPVGVYSSVPSHSYGGFMPRNPDHIAQGVPGSRVSYTLPYSRFAETGVAGAVPEYSNASSSGRQVLRSGPVKLTPGAKHTLMPIESTLDDKAAPLYSCVPFGSGGRNVSAPRGKGADFRKL